MYQPKLTGFSISFSYTIPAMKLNWFAFLRAFYRRSSSQTKPTVECFFNNMKDIVGYEGLYAVKYDGKIWCYPKKGRGGHDGKILRNVLHKTGYYLALLSSKGKVRTFLLHRVIAITCIPNPENKPQVNHKNGIKTDNRVENLEWVTPQENMQHNFYTLGNNVRNVEQYDKEGNLINTFVSTQQASLATGVHRGSIASCARGRKGNLTAGGFIWKYI